MSRRSALTHERLIGLLDYDPATGLFRWKQSRGRVSAGHVAGQLRDGYVSIKIDGVNHDAHRLAWLYVYRRWPAEDIDHRNRVRHDNRLCNLREATRSQNLCNSMKRPGRNPLKGSYYDARRGLWASMIKDGGHNRHLGYFKTAHEAHAAYMARARRLHGEFARAA